MNGFLEIRDHHNDIGRQLTNDYYMLDPDPLAPKGGEVQEKDDSEEVQSETTAEDSCLVAKDKNDAPEKQKAGGAKLQSLEG